MVTRIAILGDIHGNVAALDAALTAIERARPDLIAITGDLVMNGPRPSDVLARVRALDAAGRLRGPGQHGYRRRRLRLLGRLSLARRGARRHIGRSPSGPTTSFRMTSWPICDACRPSVGSAVGDLLVLVCHGSPGSQTDRPARRPRSLGDHPAHHADRCPRHRLRPHPRRRGPGLRAPPHRQPGLLRLRLRRRCRRRLGDAHRSTTMCSPPT